jgi:excinuclease UvrABC nuclease subunit
MSVSLRKVFGLGWRKYDHDATHLLPQCPIVYAIYSSGSLVYIGSTRNLRKRIRGHKCHNFKSWGGAETITVKARRCRKFGEWLMVELRLINRLKPRYNKEGVTR